MAGTHSQIKWTNDLILNGRKLCGILTELSVEGETGELQYVVAGIGFNVSQREEDFVGEVSKIATSILRETGRLISRAELSAAMIEELDALYTALRSGETSGYLDEYRRRCVTIGREVQLLWQDTKEKVTALDVDEEFGLIVRRENGRSRPSARGGVRARPLRICGVRRKCFEGTFGTVSHLCQDRRDDLWRRYGDAADPRARGGAE